MSEVTVRLKKKFGPKENLRTNKRNSKIILEKHNSMVYNGTKFFILKALATIIV